jgi:hypothetical protein
MFKFQQLYHRVNSSDIYYMEGWTPELLNLMEKREIPASTGNRIPIIQHVAKALHLSNNVSFIINTYLCIHDVMWLYNREIFAIQQRS